MKISFNTKFLIVGLGLMGGSYAKGLKKAGYTVYGLSDKPEVIEYALKNDIIDNGSSEIDCELIASADIIIFALYPNIFKNWIKENQQYLKSGAIITDVTGVKSALIDDINGVLRNDIEFISAHPMAGREVYSIKNSDEKIFYGANYIVVPTENNTEYAVGICKEIGKILKFSKISELNAKEHDNMIAFLSQLTHCIAVCLMTCNDAEHLEDYTGDSFRDLTRIANINENMWSELFLLNREPLINMMEQFEKDFTKLKEFIINGNSEGIKEMMRRSTERRKIFNKNI